MCWTKVFKFIPLGALGRIGTCDPSVRCHVGLLKGKGAKTEQKFEPGGLAVRWAFLLPIGKWMSSTQAGLYGLLVA